MLAPAALALLACATRAAPDAPLGLRTPGTFRELFLDPTGEDARALRGAGLDVRWTVANDWSAPTVLARGDALVDVRDDEEAHVLEVTARAPFGRVALSAEARLLAHGGGVMDGAISAWHRVLGVEDFGRSLYPADRIRVRLAERGRPALVSVEGPRVAAGDLVLRARLLLAQGGASARGPGARWGVSGRLDVKLPTGRLDALGGSGGADGGVVLLASAELAPWLTGHALVAASLWSRLPARFPLQPRRVHGTAEVSLVASRGSTALVLEDRLVSPAFEAGWAIVAADEAERKWGAGFALLRWHNQVSVGIRRGPVTAYVSEDFTPGPSRTSGARWFYDSNAPDLVVGISVRIGG